MKILERMLALLVAVPVFAGLAGCGQGESTLLGSPKDITAFGYPENTEQNFIALKESAEIFADKFTARAIAAQNGDKNFAISPISVYSALAMAAECADGTTRQEILDAMNVSYELLHSDFLNLYRSVSRKTSTAKVTLGNSVWVGEGVPVKDEGVEALAKGYGAYSYSADFAGNNKEANLAVRHFVKEQTNGLIDQDFKLSAETFFTLINTLYLKDNWNEDGDELTLTEESYAFKNGDGSTTDAHLMRGYYATMRAHEGENFNSCYAFTNSGYRLMFIVPESGFDVADVMTESNLAEAKSAEYGGYDDENKLRYNTRCIFPAFAADGNMDASGVLKDMGITELFDRENGGDLSNMLGGDVKAYCPEVKHVVKLEVDRKGIEGAAVTVLPAGDTSGDPGEYENVYYDFVVDRAFGFVIMNNYGTTLFAGTVNVI